MEDVNMKALIIAVMLFVVGAVIYFIVADTYGWWPRASIEPERAAIERPDAYEDADTPLSTGEEESILGEIDEVESAVSRAPRTGGGLWLVAVPAFIVFSSSVFFRRKFIKGVIKGVG